MCGTADTWPHFVTGDLVARADFSRIAVERPEYVLFVEDDRGDVVANACSVLFALGAEGRGGLPARGRGLSAVMLSAMRDNVRARGFRGVVAPVRPGAERLEPHTSMEEYARRVRPDGLPHDPWLRVRARAGARALRGGARTRGVCRARCVDAAPAVNRGAGQPRASRSSTSPVGASAGTGSS